MYRTIIVCIGCRKIKKSGKWVVIGLNDRREINKCLVNVDTDTCPECKNKVSHPGEAF